MASENKLIKELRDILWKLSFYKGLQDHRLKKEPPIGDPVDEISATANLRVFLLAKIGKYRELITELTGTDKATIYELGKPRMVDMWTMGLRQDYDRRSSDALNDAIVNLSMAISKLEREIDEGVRDKQGNLMEKTQGIRLEPPKAFISHGKESVALRKLKEFIETLGIEPIIVKKQASLDKDLPDKVNLYLSQADFVIILATGDDEFEGKPHPRGNVIHEVGLAQKTHQGRIIYLLEEGVEFPSNIRPKVWESFKQRNMMNAFLGIVRELRAYGMLKLIKLQLKERKT